MRRCQTALIFLAVTQATCKMHILGINFFFKKRRPNIASVNENNLKQQLRLVVFIALFSLENLPYYQ